MENSNQKKFIDASLNELLRKIVSRNVVLFLGSGFSASAHGLSSKEMPIAAALAQRIGDLNNFDADNDLRYASSRYLTKGGDKTKLIKMLRETFTVKAVEESHKAIASAPWRRVYTTNYDLCYERAAEQIGKLVETVDLSTRPSDLQANSNVCIHLNGSIKNLSIDALDSDFKLTHSSYLSPDSFLNSAWFYSFKRDLEFSSAIVFVGYSMYDIEVQKILYENPEYISKTFFITSSLESEKSKFILEQFGSILPIGAAAFSEAVAKESDNFEVEPEELILSSLWEYRFIENDINIRDSDVDAFLTHGVISDQLIDAAVMGTGGAPLLILRDELDRAQEFLKAKGNIAITAEFGNGKSIFTRVLRTLLTLEGMRVFTAEQADFRQHDDLEKIVSKGVRGFLIIDSYEQNLPLLRHYAELNPINLQIIICARAGIHERNRDYLSSINLKINEISIDDMSFEEASRFVDIIDNIGFWRDKVSLSKEAKISIVKIDNYGQISLNLLSLLSSPHIVSRVRELMSYLLSVNDYRDTVFAVALLSAIDMPLNSSLISEIALNSKIYSNDFRDNENFRQLFHMKGTRIISKSSIFSVFLISQHFPSSYIVDQLLKIVSHADNKFGEITQIQKNLLRFSVVERLLPEKQRMQNLIRYYENLKREVLWLKNDPQFWLQYGMAQLTYKNYDKAQLYFDQAYALARKKINYNTDYIDTQQARLFLLKAGSTLEIGESFKLFSDAHEILMKIPDDYHKFRQVQSYREIFDRRFLAFSKNNKTHFERACRIMLQKMNEAIQDRWTIGRPRFIEHTIAILQRILDEINEKKRK